MPISFVPYKKEYAEQIKILTTLLNGELHPGDKDRRSADFPPLTGTYQRRQVNIEILQEATRAGSDPLNSVKFLLITMHGSCDLQMKVEAKKRSGWLTRLLWWRRIPFGDDNLDAAYVISASERERARRFFAHKKIKNLLVQLGPFYSLHMAGGKLRLRYLITSHQIFTARRVADVLFRMIRLARLCENLA
jgi:hypothetical protein